MNRITLTIACCFLLVNVSMAQEVAVGIKGGYCRYLAIDKTPFYELTPQEGYSGRFCGEVSARIENKRGFFIEFGITRLSNKYDMHFPSDHGSFPYKSNQQLYLANASYQFKIQCCSLKNMYCYVGPSFALGFADITESFYGGRLIGIAVVPGLSQGFGYKINSDFSLSGSIDARYLLLYNESSGGMGHKFSRNTLLIGQVGLFYHIK